MELLREVDPGLSRVAVFWNPANAFHTLAMKQVRALSKVRRLAGYR
mgnify:CR=1 FL=1